MAALIASSLLLGQYDLWVGTNGDGVIRFKDRAVRMFTTADGLPNNVTMTVLAGQEGKLWTGANCGGLSMFDGLRFRTYSERDGLLNSCVYSLAEDANHDLWIGTYGGGAFRLREGHFTQYSKTQGLRSAVVKSIVAARDGSLWFATPEAVSRMRNGQVRNYTTADGLSSDHALNVYGDRGGGIWVGTVRGIDRLTGDRFVAVPSIPDVDIVPLTEDRSGGLYMYVGTKECERGPRPMVQLRRQRIGRVRGEFTYDRDHPKGRRLSPASRKKFLVQPATDGVGAEELMHRKTPSVASLYKNCPDPLLAKVPKNPLTLFLTLTERYL
jgi:hypothetical protein